MAKLPVVSGKEAMRVFEKAGWHFVRRARSRHMIMKKPGMKTALSIPEHKTLDRGLLRALIRRDFYKSKAYTLNMTKMLKPPEFLRPLFWEVDFPNLNLLKWPNYVIKRILEYGDKKAVCWMGQNFDKSKIREVVCKTRDLSSRSANYWAVVLEIDKRKVKCLQRHCLEIRRSCWPY